MKFALLSGLLLLGACSGPRVSFNKTYAFSSLKRVAVTRFEGPGGSAAADHLAHALLSSGADVVERSRLEALVREHRLSVSGATDARSVAEIGRLLGVDALFFGSVTQFEPPRSYVVYTGTAAVIVGGAQELGRTRSFVEGRPIGNGAARILTSAARVGLTARLVDVDTGSVVWSAHQSYEGFDIDSAIAAISDTFAQTLQHVWKQ
jgi:curli biogenesis system outer membrane secretion channel CsgG